MINNFDSDFLITFLKSKIHLILLVLIFALFVFTRFYELELRLGFDWDQTDNAWRALWLIKEGNFPLHGMVAKGSSGFFIGPLYYYYVSIFYFLTDFSPIASGVIAGVTSTITFFSLYFVGKNLFSINVGLLAVFIFSVSNYVITYDRVQWPVNFILPISLWAFYFLYKFLQGNYRNLPYLAVMLGLSLHVHFTSVFYFLIIFFCLPIFPWSRKIFKYILLSITIIFVFLIPNIIDSLILNSQQAKNLTTYISNYYHGFHGRRVMQLAGDAFIEPDLILSNPSLGFLKYLLLPLFSLAYLYKNLKRQRIILVYLATLWFLVPWLVFSVYSGEISNYYFALNRPVAILIFSYLSVRIFNIKNLFPKIAISAFWLYFAYSNMVTFLGMENGSYLGHKQRVEEAISKGEEIGFYEGVPEGYIYRVEILKNVKKN